MDASLKATLSSGPDKVVNTFPVITNNLVLPFQELSWSDFEKFCYQLGCKEMDCLDSAYIYGRPGQKQEGIDLYFKKNNEKIAWQVKRYQSFTASDVTKAVNTFNAGKWKNKVNTFMLCVSCYVNDVTLVDEIDVQSEKLVQKDVKFGVLNPDKLTDMAERHPELIRKFFGDAWSHEFSSRKDKLETEYQACIPPMKSYAGEYFGRQTDIDFVNDFFSSEEKHFLLLHGVGGMGKSHLLSKCIKTYTGKTFFYHAVDPREMFDLNKLFALCQIPIPDKTLTTIEKQLRFVREFQKNDTYLLLDDYYEVQSEEVKGMLPLLAGIGKGKLLLVSRVLPATIASQNNDFFHHKLLPLDPTHFSSFIQNYASKKKISLSEDDTRKIYSKALGYPLGGILIVDALPYCQTIDELLQNIAPFEAELDPEGKVYSGRLLDHIFQKGNPDEVKLLCEFSALFGASEIGTIRQLPSFNLKLFSGLCDRKGFIERDSQGNFSSHPMIRDFAYLQLTNPVAIHTHMGLHFEQQIDGKADKDWENLNQAILHFAQVNNNHVLEQFINRIEQAFNTRDIKSAVDIDPAKSIRNYTMLNILYPHKPHYLNQLGIAYRENKQYAKAIETLNKALEIDATNLHSLNQLGIAYRENKQYDEAISVFERYVSTKDSVYPHINLLQIYVFFKPNPQKAEQEIKAATAFHLDKPLRKRLNQYDKIVARSRNIIAITTDDISEYTHYLKHAIWCNAHSSILPILIELEKKYNHSADIKERLGRTLCALQQHDEGRIYIRKSMELYQIENNKDRMRKIILFYLYNLVYHGSKEELEREYCRLSPCLLNDPSHFQFMANYYYKLNENLNEAVQCYEKAISFAEDSSDKHIYAESLLRFLSYKDVEQYQFYFRKYESIL